MTNVMVLIFFAALPTAVARYKDKEGEEAGLWAAGAIVSAFIALLAVAPSSTAAGEALAGCSKLHGTFEHVVIDCALENLQLRYGIAPVLFWMVVGFFVGGWFHGRTHREMPPLAVQYPAVHYPAPAATPATVRPRSVDDSLLDAVDEALRRSVARSASSLGTADDSPLIPLLLAHHGASSREVAAVLAESRGQDGPSKAEVARVGRALSILSREGRVERLAASGRPLRWRRIR